MDKCAKRRNWKTCCSARECRGCEIDGRKIPWLKEANSDFKLAYLELKKKQDKAGDDVKEIMKKKTGCPTLLPAELIQKVVDLVSAVRLKGAPVSSSVICSTARGVILANNR